MRRLSQILAEPDPAKDETENWSDNWSGTDQDPGEERPDADSP